MRSASLHPHVVADYLRKEISLGRMLGPVPPSLVGRLHTNHFGVIPKGHNTGKWCLITYLSFPPGQSVNDSINPGLCSLSYTPVDKAAQIVLELGPGALLVKEDIKSAYRLVPAHRCDRQLQAVQWEGEVFVDPMLPFSLRPAPKIFNDIADAFQWYLQQQGITHVLHYLDDYLSLVQQSHRCANGTSTLYYRQQGGWGCRL